MYKHKFKVGDIVVANSFFNSIAKNLYRPTYEVVKIIPSTKTNVETIIIKLDKDGRVQAKVRADCFKLYQEANILELPDMLDDKSVIYI